MVSAVAQKGREDHWMTQVELSTLMFSNVDLKNESLPLKIEQWTMNTNTSVPITNGISQIALPL